MSLESTIASLRAFTMTGISGSNVAAFNTHLLPERQRLPHFIALAPRLNDDEYWKLLDELWHDMYDATYDDFDSHDPLLNLFRSPRPGRWDRLTKDEKQTLDALPEKVRVYRGATTATRTGACWSLDWKIARMYQARRPGDTHIWSAIVNKSDILYYCDDYKEKELLVSAVTGIELFQKGPGRVDGLIPVAGNAPTCFDWITDNVAVGDRLDSQNLPRGVFDSVLNVGIEVPILHDLPCLHLPMDIERTISIELFEQARHFLSEADRRGQKVFVHCKVGQCRSPAVVAAFLATQKKVDFATALGWVAAKRNGVYLIPEVVKSADEFVRWYAARPVTNFRIDGP